MFVYDTEGELNRMISLAPMIGPLDFSSKKVGEDITKDTANDWKGLKVVIELTVRLGYMSSPLFFVKNIKHSDNISLNDMIKIAMIYAS